MVAAAAAPSYKMKDLCDLTGLERQAIHFYIQQGLLPPGRKTGRNMAWYGPEHVERIKLIRRLQHERFLPLKVIRAMLHDQEETLSPAQRRLLGEVREHLTPMLGSGDEPAATVDAGPVLAGRGMSRADLDELCEAGFLHTRADEQGRALIAESDVWLIDLWAQLRDAGLSRELGFGPRDLGAHQQAIAAVFAAETRLLAERASHLGAAEVAAIVERALPILNQFLVRYHIALARSFFATVPTKE